MNNNAQLYVAGAIGIVAMIVAGVVGIYLPEQGGNIIAPILATAGVVVLQVMNYQKTQEAKQAVAVVAAQVAEAKGIGDANTEEIRANTFETKVVSQQNADELNKLHGMLNSERDGMKNELKAQRTEIGDLKIALDRVLTRLDQTRDEIALKDTTIEKQQATIDAAPHPPDG